MSHGHLGDRPAELDFAVKRARALATRLIGGTGEDFTDAESIGILLDHIAELERTLTLVKNAHAHPVARATHVATMPTGCSMS